MWSAWKQNAGVSRKYQELLEEEKIKSKSHMKRSRLEKKAEAGTEVKFNTTGLECGLFVKGETERVFAYTFYTTCDRNGFVLGLKSHRAMCDSQVFEDVLNRVRATFEKSLMPWPPMLDTKPLSLVKNR